MSHLTRAGFTMRFPFVLLASAMLFLQGGFTGAEEPPYVDFVRGLRARGWPDLALQYLESKSQNPPPELAAVLPLELAKTRLDLAATRADPSSRLAEQNRARAEFELFLKNNPKHPLAAEAGLEIA